MSARETNRMLALVSTIFGKCRSGGAEVLRQAGKISLAIEQQEIV